LDGYSWKVEHQMMRLYQSLSERDRRRYAAVEVEKLGHGGLEYIAKLFGCDPKTIRRGMAELESEKELTSERQRKKGGKEIANRIESATGGELQEGVERSHAW